MIPQTMDIKDSMSVGNMVKEQRFQEMHCSLPSFILTGSDMLIGVLSINK